MGKKSVCSNMDAVHCNELALLLFEPVKKPRLSPEFIMNLSQKSFGHLC